MSELISGKEALIALANGGDVEYQVVDGRNVWNKISSMAVNLILADNFKFRLKPKTIMLNGVEVGEIYSSEWNASNPYKVVIEFRNEDDARHFSNNAINIFNNVK